MEAAARRRDYYRPACAGGVEIYRLADPATTTAVASCANFGALDAKVAASGANRASLWRSETAATRC
ncbi:MAG: hypothetical protein DMF03_13715 [Verrucomicrobia bacterium]|nr:MAG: hypothetical protein DMF03_13715 [Verrucomicrobiota bacterium]